MRKASNFISFTHESAEELKGGQRQSNGLLSKILSLQLHRKLPSHDLHAIESPMSSIPTPSPHRMPNGTSSASKMMRSLDKSPIHTEESATKVLQSAKSSMKMPILKPGIGFQSTNALNIKISSGKEAIGTGTALTLGPAAQSHQHFVKKPAQSPTLLLSNSRKPSAKKTPLENLLLQILEFRNGQPQQPAQTAQPPLRSAKGQMTSMGRPQTRQLSRSPVFDPSMKTSPKIGAGGCAENELCLQETKPLTTQQVHLDRKRITGALHVNPTRFGSLPRSSATIPGTTSGGVSCGDPSTVFIGNSRKGGAISRDPRRLAQRERLARIRAVKCFEHIPTDRISLTGWHESHGGEGREHEQEDEWMEAFLNSHNNYGFLEN